VARKRNIAPGFFKNEALGECSPLARLLFAGLWCWADREGRLEDRPRKWRAEILPYDQADGDALVRELEEHGLVGRYEAAGVKVLEILNFKKHQDPHPKESASLLPARDGSFQGEPKVDPGPTQGDPGEGSCPARSLILDPRSLEKKQRAPEAESPRKAGAAARVAILGRDETLAQQYPKTAALLAALPPTGVEGAWPTTHASRGAVEMAIGDQAIADVVPRAAAAIKATGKPWLGNHLDALRPPLNGSGERRKIFEGFAADGFTPVYRDGGPKL